MSFQAVIRDSTGGLVLNQSVGLRMSILQGSVSGSSVYTETHSSTTNSSGLISIEIGGGTTTDDFSSIDWSNGPYYLQREVDPTGGTNFTISGTSQFLSVPYALHAKTAETVTGGITETDPIYSASEAAKIDATDITNLSNLSGTNTGDQDVSSLATKTALSDSTGQVRSEIPDVSGFLTSETDPIYSASEAAKIDATDITNLSNLSGTNTGDQDLSTLATKTALSDSTGQVRSEIPSGVQIGDFAQGGIVFWVDETGQHGLVAAKEDHINPVRWRAGTNGNTQAKGDGLYAGKANTSIIIAAQVYIGDDGDLYAARICNELQVAEGGTTYGDWYLPSKKELDLMYQNRATINATAWANGGSDFLSTIYWSSTEYSRESVWSQDFTDGRQITSGKFVTVYSLRAVRAF
jgi:hypothetical protein